MTLDLWPAAQRAPLAALIAAQAGSGAIAVFDLDNTCWLGDVTEALICWLELRGVLTPETLDPAIHVTPFRPGESLFGHYLRLDAEDPLVSFPWLACAFSGLTIGQLRAEVAAMLAAGAPVPRSDGPAVPLPRVFSAMRQLIAALEGAGIAVWAVTAANEEVARILAADPQHGLGLPPGRVVGAGMLLRAPDGSTATARRLIAEGRWQAEAMADWRLTAFQATVQTWFEGKLAAILGRIGPWRRPVLIAGDSAASDGTMLLHGLAPGGLRLWVERDPAQTAAMRRRVAEAVAAGRADAAEGWVEVAARDLGPV